MVIEQSHAPNKKVLAPIQQSLPNSSTNNNHTNANNQGKGKVNMITPTNESQAEAVNFI